MYSIQVSFHGLKTKIGIYPGVIFRKAKLHI